MSVAEALANRFKVKIRIGLGKVYNYFWGGYLFPSIAPDDFGRVAVT